MKQTDRNKLFEYFRQEHLILLTDEDIDEVVILTEKSTIEHTTKIIKERVNNYRVINVILLAILNLLFPDKGMSFIFWIFILYNISHVIYTVIKKILDEQRILRGKGFSRGNK